MYFSFAQVGLIFTSRPHHLKGLDFMVKTHLLTHIYIGIRLTSFGIPHISFIWLTQEDLFTCARRKEKLTFVLTNIFWLLFNQCWLGLFLFVWPSCWLMFEGRVVCVSLTMFDQRFISILVCWLRFYHKSTIALRTRIWPRNWRPNFAPLTGSLRPKFIPLVQTLFMNSIDQILSPLTGLTWHLLRS